MSKNPNTNSPGLPVKVLILLLTTLGTNCFVGAQVGINASGALAALPQGAKPVEDLTVVSNVMVQGRPVATQTAYYSGRKTRRVGVPNNRNSEGSDQIQDFSLQRIVTIDHAKKEFYQNSMAEITSALEKKAVQESAKMEKAVAQNPELEAFLRSEALKVTSSQNRKAKTIAGYSCDQYTFGMGSLLKIITCANESLPAPPSIYRDSMFSGDPITRKYAWQMFAEMEKQTKGYPLLFRMNLDVFGDRFEVSVEATQVKLEKIPESVFEPPADYKRKNGLPKNISGAMNLKPD